MLIDKKIIEYVKTLPKNEQLIDTQNKLCTMVGDVNLNSFEIVELLCLLDVFEDENALCSVTNELERGIMNNDQLPFTIIVETILSNFTKELEEKTK